MFDRKCCGIKSENKKLIVHLRRSGEFRKKISAMRRLFFFKDDVDAVVFPDKESVENELGRKLPDWFVGAAVAGKIFVIDYDIWKDKNPSNLWQIIVHELTHIIVSRMMEVKCPEWLNEGLALFFADQVCRSYSADIFDGGKDVYEMNRFDDNFYAMSGLIVAKLVELFGIGEIFCRMTDGQLETDSILGKENVAKIIKENLLSRVAG
jgi:hypothetical protein